MFLVPTLQLVYQQSWGTATEQSAAAQLGMQSSCGCGSASQDRAELCTLELSLHTAWKKVVSPAKCGEICL